MKTTIVKIDIDAELFIPEILGASRIYEGVVPEDAPEFLTQLANNAVQVLSSHGFKKSAVSDTLISEVNGGYSLYLTYIWRDPDACIKLLLNLRVANHKAKPSLKDRNATRLEIAQNAAEAERDNAKQLESVDTDVFDIPYQSRKWGVQIFVGSDKDQDYSDPVTSIETAMTIFSKKVEKVLSKYS